MAEPSFGTIDQDFTIKKRMVKCSTPGSGYIISKVLLRYCAVILYFKCFKHVASFINFKVINNNSLAWVNQLYWKKEEQEWQDEEEEEEEVRKQLLHVFIIVGKLGLCHSSSSSSSSSSSLGRWTQIGHFVDRYCFWVCTLQKLELGGGMLD